MNGVYHYRGMKLHFLDEDGTYAVYHTSKDRYNQFWVYKLGRKFGSRGWVTTHKLIGKYGDLFSGICTIRQMQGCSI